MSLYLLLGKEGRTLMGSICWFLYYKYSQYGQFETWCQLALKIPQIWAISFFEWLKTSSYTPSQVELKQSWKEFIRLQLSLLRLFYVCVGEGMGAGTEREEEYMRGWNTVSFCTAQKPAFVLHSQPWQKNKQTNLSLNKHWA